MAVDLLMCMIRITRMRTIVKGLAERLGHVLCGLSGHRAYLEFEQARIYLHCQECGYCSPGWDLVPVDDVSISKLSTIRTLI
jgi:hypothetical protein